MVAYKVVLKLGHCGARPNEYTVKRGSKAQCEKYVDNLPSGADNRCDRCGRYAGTNPVYEACSIEQDED